MKVIPVLSITWLGPTPHTTHWPELNTAPMHTPANASPRHHWSSRHSSGPEWIATPYSVEDLALTAASPPTSCRF